MLDQAGTMTSAHRQLLKDSLGRETAFDFREYVAARWEQGLMRPASFAQLSDFPGNRWSSLPSHRETSFKDQEICRVILGPSSPSHCEEELRCAGFQQVDTIHSDVSCGRRVIGQFLKLIPGHQKRAKKIDFGSTPASFRTTEFTGTTDREDLGHP